MKLEEEIAQKKFRNEYHKATVNIIYTFNWLTGYHQSILKRHAITLQQFNILRILRGQHPRPCTVKLVRERMLDKMSDTSRLIEKLRVKGFVERSSSPLDRRQVDVRITEKGMKLLSVIDDDNERMDKILSNITESEAQKLNEILDKIRG